MTIQGISLTAPEAHVNLAARYARKALFRELRNVADDSSVESGRLPYVVGTELRNEAAHMSFCLCPWLRHS